MLMSVSSSSSSSKSRFAVLVSADKPDAKIRFSVP